MSVRYPLLPTLLAALLLAPALAAAKTPAGQRVYINPLFGVPGLEQPVASSCPGSARSFMVPGRGQRQREDSRLRDDARVMETPATPAPEMRSPASPLADKTVAAAPVAKVAAGAARSPAPAPRAMAAEPEVDALVAPASQDAVPYPGATEPVKAGYVDDNADFGEYLAYLKRNAALRGYRPRDVAERYRVLVRDPQGHPLANALISAQMGEDSPVVWARSDQKGQAWFAPNAVFDRRFVEEDITLSASTGGQTGSAHLHRGQKQGVDIRVDAVPAPVQGLDLVFLVDATGSMGDEIAKLRSSLHTIAGRISTLRGRPDLCIGLVAYRDQDDAFLIRGLSLSRDVKKVQQELDGLQAEGGGDRPEALNESFAYSINRLQWRGGNTVRELILVSDAEPHMDYGPPYYDQTAAVALAKGIRLHAVGASGLSPEGEFVFRQMAQYTGGKFAFLTYRDAQHPERGAGDQTVHDVKGYSVDTLDEVIVRLIREDLHG